MNRPGVRALMRQIEAGEIKIVLIFKLERVLRSTDEWGPFRSFLQQHGCRLVSPTEDLAGFDQSLQRLNPRPVHGATRVGRIGEARHFEPAVAGVFRDEIAADGGLTLAGIEAPADLVGGRELGLELELTTRAAIRKPVTVDLFPAYDEDGGLLVALTPRTASELPASG